MYNNYIRILPYPLRSLFSTAGILTFKVPFLGLLNVGLHLDSCALDKDTARYSLSLPAGGALAQVLDSQGAQL